jgi:phosphohistidine phosphatase SixA
MFLLQRTIAALCIATALPALAQDIPALLREGGVTLYFRHAATDFSQRDADDRSLANCSKQRNLSDAGREDARAVGEAMRALRVPVRNVLASPYCRTLETARLMLGRATPTREVLGHMTPGGAPDYASVDKVLSAMPPRGTVDVVVSHGNPFRALSGIQLLEGEAAVVQSDGNRWSVVARVPPGQWRALALAASSKKGP